MNKTIPLYIGVDGGGTKTVASLGQLDLKGELICKGQGRAGPSNPLVVGYDVAAENIELAIKDALHGVANVDGEIAAGCLAIAGCGTDSRQDGISELLSRRLSFQSLTFTHDANAVLHANVSGRPCGVALIAGTGSMAYGSDVDGNTVRSGGWGFRFGDEGSGYWIAVRGLNAAVKNADGRGSETGILDGMLTQLGLDSVSQLVDRVYQESFQRSDYAKLAQVVFRAARQRDKMAELILKDARHELLDLVQSCIAKLKLQHQEFMVNLAGGILVGNDDFREALTNEMYRMESAPATVNVVEEPSLGALKLAMSR